MIRAPLVAAVDIGDDIAASLCQGEIARRARARPILAECSNPWIAGICRKYRGRLVVAAVIDDDQLPTLVTLGENAVDRARQHGSAIPRGHDDRNGRPAARVRPRPVQLAPKHDARGICSPQAQLPARIAHHDSQGSARPMRTPDFEEPPSQPDDRRDAHRRTSPAPRLSYAARSTLPMAKVAEPLEEALELTELVPRASVG